MSDSIDPALLTPIQKLTKDLREASRTLGPAEARFLVDAYYKIQEDRIRSAHQVRTLSQATDDKAPEPHDTIAWLFTQEQTLENQIKAALDVYGAGQPAGVWMRSIVGIGPVITAGFLAHIDIAKAPTVGHIWRFVASTLRSNGTRGPNVRGMGQLKRLCWIVGESFTKSATTPTTPTASSTSSAKSVRSRATRPGITPSRLPHHSRPSGSGTIRRRRNIIWRGSCPRLAFISGRNAMPLNGFSRTHTP